MPGENKIQEERRFWTMQSRQRGYQHKLHHQGKNIKRLAMLNTVNRATGPGNRTINEEVRFELSCHVAQSIGSRAE
jgi:hypothetical protein